jgi:hypothetical protein
MASWLWNAAAHAWATSCGGGISDWVHILFRTQATKSQKSKRVPSIFNDESTESFICLRRHIYMSHVNKVQPTRVKMICIAAIRVTCMKDFVSVVKILLKVFFFCSLFPPPPPPPTIRAPCASSYSVYYHYLASPHSFLQQATPHIRLRNVFQGQREKQPNDF